MEENKEITISYEITENNKETNIALQQLLQEFDQVVYEDDETSIVEQMKFYDENYTNKQLLLICEYYGINKQARTMKKQDIITLILLFERETENIEIVMKRKIFWSYIEELKGDKIMKRYIINW
jgi:hypothetical protein